VSDLKKYIKKQMKDPSFKAEYEDARPEQENWYQTIQYQPNRVWHIIAEYRYS
jgi:hypothetical protein